VDIIVATLRFFAARVLLKFFRIIPKNGTKNSSILYIWQFVLELGLPHLRSRKLLVAIALWPSRNKWKKKKNINTVAAFLLSAFSTLFSCAATLHLTSNGCRFNLPKNKQSACLLKKSLSEYDDSEGGLNKGARYPEIGFLNSCY
jgi:hypothetical protein